MPAEKIVDAKVTNDPTLDHYKVTELSRFTVENVLGNNDTQAVTLHESYERGGKAWDCSVTVTLGQGYTGGVAKSCDVAPTPPR